MGTIGLIAGGGQFPRLVAQAARAAGQGIVSVGFSGNTDAGLDDAVDAYEELHLGQFARCVKFMKSHGVQKVVFAGTISKPRAVDLRPDWLAAKILFRLKTKGDNAILSAVAEEMDAQGLPVASALELLPSLATPEGPLTKKAPRKHEIEELRGAWPKARAMGRLDIGQSLVVKSGIVAAVEGPEGTDAALRRAGELVGKGCVLCKICKPGQDLRLDLPAAGLETVRTLIDMGGTCLGIEAHKSIFFDLEEAVALAEKHNVRLIGLSASILGLDEE